MRWQANFWLAMLGLLNLVVPSRTAAAEEAALPTWAIVETATIAHFRQLPNHRPGVIITRDEVRSLLEVLAKLGWTVPEADPLVQRALSADDFLVKELRTPAGMEFASRISRIPQGYDRADHLIRLPSGQRTLRDLVRGPDGHKMIDYLATAKGGKNMGRMLSKAPGGENFNQPSGRIYTADQLLAELRLSYESQQNKAAQK